MSNADMNSAERRIIAYESFLCGSLDSDAIFAQWRYAEAPSFQDSFALEVNTWSGSVNALKRVYALDGDSQYAEATRVFAATLSQDIWEHMQQEGMLKSLRLPKISNTAGMDGTMYALRIGSKASVQVRWWSDFPDDFAEMVSYANRWKEHLLNLKWDERR